MKFKILASLGMFAAVLAPNAQAAFTDINGSVNAEAILFVQQEGIVEGYSDGSYKPNNSINRAEFTKIVVGSMNNTDIMAGANCFTDVEANIWYASYVCTAKAKGVIGGYPDGTFKPANLVNYAEAAKIIVEANGMQKVDMGGTWYDGYIKALANANSSLKISPSAELSRGQMAQLIFNIKNHEKMMMDDEMDGEVGVEVGGALMVESKNIVENAMNANNVTTLVAAVQAAGLVDTLSGEGPFTVFAPTDSAFAALPAGTVDTLLMTENKGSLANILTYHVVAGAYTSADLADGMTLKTVQGGDLTITYEGNTWFVNGAKILIADVKSSNGVTFVIDGVLTPEADMTDEMSANGYVEYSADLMNDGKSKVLFFHASWCPSCQADNVLLTELSASTDFTYNVAKVDYDTATELKAQYGVTTQHTYVLVDAEGNLVQKWVGPSDAELTALVTAQM